MGIVSTIRSFSERRKLSITALERELGFGKGTITKWDKCSPSADKLQKVADYFGITVDRILERDTDLTQNGIKGTYFRLAKGAERLGLTDDDVDAILNLYEKHQERNR